MKVAVSTLIAFLFLTSNSYAFFDGLKDVVDKGNLEMTDIKEGKHESIFICPPFKTRQEAREIWKTQVKEFCKDEFTIHQESYENNPKASNAIYAIVSCGISEVIADTNTDITEGEQEAITGDDAGLVSSSTSVVSLKPEKTKKVFYNKETALGNGEVVTEQPPQVVQERTQPTSASAKEINSEPAMEEEQEASEETVQDVDIDDYIVKLNSNKSDIMREYARKMFYNNLSDQRLLDAAEKVLASNYRVDNGKIHADGLGWLCKVLGGSGQLKYRKFLDKIANSGATFKLRWHAAIQRDKLSKSEPTEAQLKKQKKIEIEKKLIKLKKLYDDGLITDEEYSEKKALLLEEL